MTFVTRASWSAGATRLWVVMLFAALFSACASKPVPPDWQANAHGALKDFTAAYLSGNSRVATQEFARARGEISSTGRADLMARAELVRCAARVASLEFDNCAGLAGFRGLTGVAGAGSEGGVGSGVGLMDDAGPTERAYAAFLTARWQGLDASALPEQYRGLVVAADAAARNATLAGIKDPLSQMVATGVLLQMGQLAPVGIAAAVDTASKQGWRRPLLAWLGVQLQRADAAGDTEAKARIQRRIDLVSDVMTGSQPANR